MQTQRIRGVLCKLQRVCAPLRLPLLPAGAAPAIGNITGALMMLAAVLIVPASGNAASASSADAAFRQWVERLWPAVRAKGVSRSTFDTAFRGVTPDPEVIQSANYQPEFVRPVWDYMASAVSEERVAKGRDLLTSHQELFDLLEQRYNVDRHVIAAIWGMESNFGLNRGDLGVVRSLATLAYRDRRRARFGRTQLLSALRILQRGDIDAAGLTGSWAGAMGHTQFIPTTYDAYAVDHDGDGRRDIWNSHADALASTANYLRASNWRRGTAWGYEVILPKALKGSRSGMGTRRSIKQWLKAGVVRAGGQEFPSQGEQATLFLPAGGKGPAFLVMSNFRSIMRYNNATTYALAIGHLSDRLKGDGGLVGVWPTHHKPLARDERIELQKLLTAKGFDTGGMDGIFGNQTLRAVRDYQKARGTEEVSWPSVQLLETLRTDS